MATAPAVVKRSCLDWKSGHGGALALGTALAVILHKPFGALAITTLMAAGGSTRRGQFMVNGVFALVTPAGALLFFVGAGEFIHAHAAVLGAALAFCAGTFLCIASADLLPELQFHKHDRVKLSLALLVGIAVAWLIVSLAMLDRSTAGRHCFSYHFAMIIGGLAGHPLNRPSGTFSPTGEKAGMRAHG
jgi:hypothetical protein